VTFVSVPTGTPKQYRPSPQDARGLRGISVILIPVQDSRRDRFLSYDFMERWRPSGPFWADVTVPTDYVRTTKMMSIFQSMFTTTRNVAQERLISIPTALRNCFPPKYNGYRQVCSKSDA